MRTAWHNSLAVFNNAFLNETLGLKKPLNRLEYYPVTYAQLTFRLL